MGGTASNTHTHIHTHVEARRGLLLPSRVTDTRFGHSLGVCLWRVFKLHDERGEEKFILGDVTVKQEYGPLSGTRTHDNTGPSSRRLLYFIITGMSAPVRDETRRD